jgi:two-component system, NtrC family, nitrogen regulation response regulator NtrX
MATILIVDDEATSRRPLAALLEYEGYTIAEAGDGLEGLRRLGEAGADLVLLDMTMPGVDGVTMLQAIRHRQDWANLPVLLCTGEHNPEMLRKCAKVGVQEYIFKGDTPFSKMLELIKRHLGEHHVPKRRGRKPKIRPDGSLPVVKPEDHAANTSRFLELQLGFEESQADC